MSERIPIGTFKYEGGRTTYTFFRSLGSGSVAVEDTEGNRWTVLSNLGYVFDLHRDTRKLTDQELFYSIRH